MPGGKGPGVGNGSASKALSNSSWGHIIIIRQVLKKAGIGSKLGSRSRRNVRILALIIAHIICILLPITVKVIKVIIIIWIIVLVP